MTTKTKENFFKPILPKRNSEYIANQIEDAIISKVYQPGEKLPTERDLASQFAVGRGAIREAIRILDALGYIEVKHGGDGGTYIREFDSSRMTKSVSDLIRFGNISHKDLTEVRIVIEAANLETCFDLIGENEIALLEENIKHCVALNMKKESTYGVIQDFHLLLSSFSKNRLSQYILESLVEISDSYVKSVEKPVGHVTQHEKIVQAIRNGDKAQSVQMLKEHLGAVSKQIGEM